MIRNVVLVVFHHSATQRERQSAIHRVHGTVVGGLPIGGVETFYVVRIPYKLAVGDSSSGPLLRACEALKAIPTVDSAIPVLMDPSKDYINVKQPRRPRSPR